MDNQQVRTYHLNLVNSNKKSYKHGEFGGLKRKHFRAFIGFVFCLVEKMARNKIGYKMLSKQYYWNLI